MPNTYNFNEEIGKAIDEWAVEASAILIEAARKNAPSDTGEFRQSLYTVFSKEGGGATIEIRSDSEHPQMDWIIDGTRAHTIETVHAKALMWQEKGGGEVIFAKSVQHPGTQPNDFAERTIEEVAPVLVQLLGDMIGKQI